MIAGRGTVILDWLSFVLASPVAASHRPDVIVSEVAWAGSSASASDEWLELWNGDEEIVDLTGWSVWDVAADPPKLLVTIDDGQIAPAGHFLIANNAADHAFKDGPSTLAAVPDVIASDLSLSNSQLALKLRTGDGDVTDEIGDAKQPLAGDRTTHASMSRKLDHVRKGNRERAWETSTEQAGFDPGAPDLGTPMPSGRPVIGQDECRVIWNPTDETQPLPVSITDPDPATPLTEIRVNGVVADTVFLTRPAAFGRHPLRLDVLDSSGLSRRHETTCLHAQTSPSITLSEIYAAPRAGTEEFVELHNTGPVPVNLVGWQLGDATESDGYTVAESLVLAPGERRAFFQTTTKLRLNDSGETVQLTDPAGTVLNSVTTGRSKKGLSWSFADRWGWATPTPDTPNLLLPGDVEDAVGGAPLPATLADLVARRAPAEPGATVELVATVTVPLGLYDDRQFIVADGEWAAEVQLPEGSTVELVAGDVVRLIGRVSRSRFPRLLVEPSGIKRRSERRSDRIEVTGDHEPRPLQRLRLTGRIVRQNGENYVLVGSRRYQVTSRRGLALVPVGEGDEITVEGLVVELDPLRLRVLTEDGFVVVQSSAISSVSSVDVSASPEVVGVSPSTVSPSTVESAPVLPVVPTIPDAIVTAIQTLTERILGIHSALAAGAEAIVAKPHIAPAAQRTPAVSLITLFALLAVAAILADWLWQFLLAQSGHFAHSGRSPPSL